MSTDATVADFAAQITVPVLMIVADQDDITPLDAQCAVQQDFADAELHVLEGVGHLVHYEKPIETASTIRDFLSRHSD